jgi:hypothetical protein
MANEISVTATMVAAKNGVTLQHSTTARHDMSGNEMVHRTQLIGTSAEQISFGDITGAPGMVKFTNLDATNFVEVALDSGMTNKLCKIRPGGTALFQPSSGTLYAKTDTASVRMLVQAAEL